MKARPFFLLLFIFSLSACSFKATPAPPTEFLAGPEKLVLQRGRYPFHEIWISDSYKKQRGRFDKLMIEEVDLDYLMQTGDWKHISVYSEEKIKERAKKLAEYMQESFKEAFLEDDNKRFTLVDEPGPNTLALQVAIVELIPTDVVRNAAGNVVGFFVPGGGLVSAGAGGTIATEGRMTDAMTGVLYGKFKDRESAKIRPVDLEGLSAFAFAREAIDDWTFQTMKLLNTPIEARVADSSAVSISPW